MGGCGGRGIDVYGVKNLRETFQFLKGEHPLMPVKEDLDAFFASHQIYDADSSDVKGQQHLKRAIEVVVSGGHNLVIL